MKTGIIDYGMGNLGSVTRALLRLGCEPEITDRPERLADVARIVLPGVGGFADAMRLLERRGWPDAIRAEAATGKPVLGICLGMQLLASRGTEGGETDGLNLIEGVVQRLDTLGSLERVPHVGWNSIRRCVDPLLLRGIPDQTDFYFVHSYIFVPVDMGDVAAQAHYGVDFCCIVQRRNIMGTQFHPEKSSKAGLQLLRNFLELQPC